MEKLCKHLEDKFCKLLSFLGQLPGNLEMIADEIDNENLRNALSAVAIETNQYANELSAQLKDYDIIPPDPGNNSLLEKVILVSKELNSKNTKGTEVWSICEGCEAFFSGLYTDLLNDYLPSQRLKDLVNYQLLGIRYSFLRIRFLNSVRFNN